MVLIGVSGSVCLCFLVRFCIVCGALQCCYGCASTMLPELCREGSFKRRRQGA